MNERATATATRSFWAWVPALLLASMLAGLGTLTYIACDDPHFALEPNYYDKAVHWDRSRAAARASAETGFRAVFNPLSTAAEGNVELKLQLSDKQDQPVSGAAVEIEAFPNAFATRIQRLTLRETAPGVYVGELSRATLGLWELRLDVTRGAQRFRQVVRSDVVKGGAA